MDVIGKRMGDAITNDLARPTLVFYNLNRQSRIFSLFYYTEMTNRMIYKTKPG